jgi:hypothetical protein
MASGGVCGALAAGAVDTARWAPEALAAVGEACARAAMEPVPPGGVAVPLATGVALALGLLLGLLLGLAVRATPPAVRGHGSRGRS